MTEKQSYKVKLKKAFLNACPQIINALENIITKQDELNLLSKSFATFLLECKNETVWKWIIKSYIKGTNNEEAFFNDKSLSYLTLLNFVNIASKAIKKNIMASTIDKVKAHCNNSNNNLNDFDLIIEMVKVFIDHFKKAAVPKELKVLLILLKDGLTKKFKNSNATLLRFLFISYIPDIFDSINVLFKEHNFDEVKITKKDLEDVFLMIANATIYNEGEKLYGLNEAIKYAQSRISSYFSNLTTIDELEEQSIFGFSEEEAEAAYNCILYCANAKKSLIVNYRSSTENISTHQNKILFDFMSLLEEYQSVVGKIELDDLSALGIKKNSFFLRNLFKSTTSNDNEEFKKNKVPFVKQQSERWNREHQKMLIEQRKREKDEKELQQRKNAYARKKSLIAQGKKDSYGVLIKKEEYEIKENIKEKKEKNVEKNENEQKGKKEADEAQTKREEYEEKENAKEKKEKNVEKNENEQKNKDINTDEQKNDTETTDDNEEYSKPKDTVTSSVKKKKKKKKYQDDESNKTQKVKETHSPRERSNSYQTLSPELKKEILEYHKISVSIKNQIRQLAIENKNHEKEKKHYLDEIESLRHEINETKAINEKQLNQMFTFNSKLINSIIYRKQKSLELKNLSLSLRRSLHPSFDDDMYDYSLISPEQRSKIALNARKNQLLRSKTKENTLKPNKRIEERKESQESCVNVTSESDTSTEQLNNKTKQNKGKNTNEGVKNKGRGMKKRSISEHRPRKSKRKLL